MNRSNRDFDASSDSVRESRAGDRIGPLAGKLAFRACDGPPRRFPNACPWPELADLRLLSRAINSFQNVVATICPSSEYRNRTAHQRRMLAGFGTAVGTRISQLDLRDDRNS